MKTRLALTIFSLCFVSSLVQADEQKPLIYVNQNFGFNVPGYKYNQAEFPCDIDKHLVEFLIEDSNKAGINMQAVSTADKVQNGRIPVVVIDIEQLALGKDFSFGTKREAVLPKVQVTAGLIQGENMELAKHSCAIATLNELTPSSDVLDLGVYMSTCSVAQKCLKDLSKDIVEWVAPQVK